MIIGLTIPLDTSGNQRLSNRIKHNLDTLNARVFGQRDTMIFIDLSKTVPELLKKAGCSAFQFFLIVSITATIVAGVIISNSGRFVEWTDPGVQLIALVTAMITYAAIWRFVKKITR